jgi:hypothetical protein
MIGGPVRNPSQPSVETAATPEAGASGVARAAARKTFGTTVAKPSPSVAKPRIPSVVVRASSAIVSTTTASAVNARSGRVAPHRRAVRSPPSRPRTMAAENAK